MSRMSRAYKEAQEFLLDGRPLDDDLIAVLRALTDDEIGVLRDTCERGLAAMQEQIEALTQRRARIRSNRECLRMEIAHRFPHEACGERPEITVSSDGRTGEGAQIVLSAMAEAFSCSEPRGHSEDHVARDINGERLCWWPR